VQNSNSAQEHLSARVAASVVASDEENWLAVCSLIERYLAPNDLHALACFNQLVPGHWLGTEAAVIVSRPNRLVRYVLW
jgi:hypothetical protein